MTAPSLLIRPLNTEEEYSRQFTMADQAFNPQPSVESVQSWQRFVTTMPDFRPQQARGAFLNGVHVGGYLFHEHVMRVGGAAISTGCIGAVVVDSTYRQQRVASALMADANDFAQAHGHPLLLLDGIPKFYHRFGYTDVIDLSIIDIERAAVLAQPASPYTTRPATADDAQSMLALYQRHYYPYTGSFERSLEQQFARLNAGRPAHRMLAVAPGGEIAGYLLLSKDNIAMELAADNWEAILALLRYHAQQPTEPGDAAPASLHYRLPPLSPLVHTFIDHLESPDTSHWQNPADAWAVQSCTFHHRDAAWMGRFVGLSTLMQALLPALQARWQRALAHWTGALHIFCGAEEITLSIDGAHLSLSDTSHPAAPTLGITPQAFTQLVFGYRPIAAAMPSSHPALPAETLAALSILFPPDHAWIAPTDWF